MSEVGIGSLCVFCGSALGANPEYRELALNLGLRLGQKKKVLVYGGGSIGLMGVVADACKEAGGRVIGVIPEHLNKSEIAHNGLDRLILVESMFERKERMLKLSDAFLTLPGGMGTLDEVLEMITLAQLKQHQKPVLLLNHKNFFTPLLEQINVGVREGFIQEKYVGLLQVVSNLEQAYDLLGL